MLSLSRLSLSLAALGFGLYHFFLGLVNLGEYQDRSLALSASVIYLVALLVSVLDKPGIRMRPITAFVNMLAVVSVPQLVFIALGEVRQGSYATWQIAAVSTLLAILSVRQYQLFAWVGMLILTFEVLMWGGTDVLFNSGLFGGFLLVLVAQTAAWAIRSSATEAERFRNRAYEIDTATAASTAARAERKDRLEQTLSEVRPMLELISRQQGELTEQQREKALITEAELRDQIRGRNLISPEITKAVRKARRAGIEVQLLDDGGLDDLDERSRAKLLTEIALQLGKVKEGKVVVRASRGDSWRLTIAAIRKDEDRPDLFVRL